MTEIEAHQFIERCRRNMYPWRAKTEAQAALGMQKFSIGFAGGIFFGIMTEISEKSLGFYSELIFVAFLLSIFCLFSWLASKLHQARQILGCSQIVNHKS
jgi:type III secretory pathway component EscS